MDGGTTALLTITALNANDPLVAEGITMSAVNSGYTFAYIGDLVAKYPQLAGKGPLRIEIDSDVHQRAAWAFVSVTNNDTQHVTVISPQ